MSKHQFDPILNELARKFLGFQPFPESDLERATKRLENGPRFKHVERFPRKELFFSVRFFFAGRTRFLALAERHQLDDATRFADACTLRFWKYRQRGDATTPDPKQFNFSPEAAQADLDDWVKTQLYVVELIDDIEAHFLEVGVFKFEGEIAAAEPSPASRKTIRGEIDHLRRTLLECHQEVLEALRNHMPPLKESKPFLNENNPAPVLLSELT